MNRNICRDKPRWFVDVVGGYGISCFTRGTPYTNSVCTARYDKKCLGTSTTPISGQAYVLNAVGIYVVYVHWQDWQ